MKTGSELRAEALDEAKAAVCRDRQNAYGDAEDNFADIADVWNILFADKLADGEVFTALDVAKAFAGAKLCRLRVTPDHRDTWIDIIGYGACGAGIAQRPIEDAAEAAAQAVLNDPVVPSRLSSTEAEYVPPFVRVRQKLSDISIGNAQADFGGANP